MALIDKFGQYLLLEIRSADNQVVLKTDNLRIDFDVREIYSFSRCKITVFNLKQETVKALSARDNLVTIKASLHGGDLFTIVDNMYISNSLTTRVVPNTMTYLYAFSNIRKGVLEKQVSIQVKNPSLEKLVKELLTAGGHTGEVDFKFFPQEILDYIPPKLTSRLEGSVVSKLDLLAKEYKFKYYTIGKDIRIGYVVDDSNFDATSLSEDTDSIVLNSKSMRSNPKLGPATLDINSNLDPRIQPLVKLNVSRLLTAELSGVTDLQLAVASRLVLDTVSGRSNYQVLSVNNKGSNWTKDWSTMAHAVTPTNGVNMPTNNWFR